MGADVYIITVPTPVDAMNQPDLGAVLSATRMVAGLIDPARRPTIVYESTVYPGVTEDICGPEIERTATLKRGRDFRLGYNPERINPGDREHTVDKIVKVVAGQDSEVLDQLAGVYGAVTLRSGMCLPPLGLNGTSSASSLDWSEATASASILII